MKCRMKSSITPKMIMIQNDFENTLAKIVVFKRGTDISNNIHSATIWVFHDKILNFKNLKLRITIKKTKSFERLFSWLAQKRIGNNISKSILQ